MLNQKNFRSIQNFNSKLRQNLTKLSHYNWNPIYEVFAHFFAKNCLKNPAAKSPFLQCQINSPQGSLALNYNVIMHSLCQPNDNRHSHKVHRQFSFFFLSFCQVSNTSFWIKTPEKIIASSVNVNRSWIGCSQVSLQTNCAIAKH